MPTRLTEKTVSLIRGLSARGYTDTMLGRIFGITQSHATNITTKRVWPKTPTYPPTSDLVKLWANRYPLEELQFKSATCAFFKYNRRGADQTYAFFKYNRRGADQTYRNVGAILCTISDPKKFEEYLTNWAQQLGLTCDELMHYVALHREIQAVA